MKQRNGSKQATFDFSAADSRCVDEVLPPQPRPNGQSHAARLKSRGQLRLFDSNSEPPPAVVSVPEEPPPTARPLPQLSSGTVSKARDILAAIKTLKLVEQEHRPATSDEAATLSRFCAFGPVALFLFPDPMTGAYKDASSERLGHELRDLLTVEEYDSAKRTTFNAFYTSPNVMAAMHEGLARLGLPANGTVLEPGCGVGRFMSVARQQQYGYDQ